MALLSIVKLVLVALHTVIVAPIVVAVALFDQRAAYRVCRLWVHVNLRICGARVRTRWLATLDPRTPYVFVSNHRSQFDILAVVAALRDFQLRWVAKKELLRVPVFGWALRHTGHIIIDRSDHVQAVSRLRAARAQMEAGVSVVIFPEGTRAPADAVLLPFKKGGFMLAIETGFALVPLVVRGSARVLPARSWSIGSGTIEVVVGAPIAVEGRTRDGLMEEVRGFMLAQLGAAPDAVDPPLAVGAR